jgi:sugar phosphate isomerase/epimerase
MKICVQTGGLIDELGVERCYKTLSYIGFEGIDWNLDHALRAKDITSNNYEGNCIFEKSMEEILEYYKEELFHIRKNGLAISQAHAPFPPCVSGKPETLDYMIKIYKKIILFCQEVGCRHLVIHGHSSAGSDEMYAINDKLYTSLIPELKKTDVIVCLENLNARSGNCLYEGVCGNPYEAVELIDKYNAMAGKECFGLCLDIGHLNLQRKEPARYIRVLGKRIKALHVHDNAGELDQHKAPYTGTVNWKEFYTALAEVGYEGDLSFETFNQVRLGDDAAELTEPWLNLIFAIGKLFRRKIEKI